MLANGLGCVKLVRESLQVNEALLAQKLRDHPNDIDGICLLENNIATCFNDLGRHEEALGLLKNGYERYVSLLGPKHERSIMAGQNYGTMLLNVEKFAEARSFLRQYASHIQGLGENHPVTIRARWSYANALQGDPGASMDDLLEAEATLASVLTAWARIMGLQHPETPHLRAALVQARTKVAHARLLATGEATTSFEPVPGLDLEHVVIHGFPPGSAEATCCFLVFWSCAAVALAWLVFFYKY